MNTNNEARRKDDERADDKLQWEPARSICDDAIRTSKQCALINAAHDLLQTMGTTGAAIPMPDTEPQRYILIGDGAAMGKLLPEALSANNAKNNAVQQAQRWAQEARMQRATVLSILRYFGLPEHDWEALRLIAEKVLAGQPSPSVPRVASIDTPELRRLMSAYEKAFNHGTIPETSKAWAALIGHIDAHVARQDQAAPVGYVRDGKDGVWGELEESAIDRVKEGAALYLAAPSSTPAAVQAAPDDARELSEPEIVEVLASLGIDSEPSKYGFDTLQVRTTVPAIPKIVAAYLRRSTPAAAQAAPAEQRDAVLDHALWLLMQFPIHRYLMSNAHGRWDGAEKAERHIELCKIVVAVTRGIEPDTVRQTHEDDYEAVHHATQELTDRLDEAIGFPLESDPDYDQLAPLFFERFLALAIRALRSTSTDSERLCDEGSFYSVARARGFTNFGLTISGNYSDSELQAFRERYDASTAAQAATDKPLVRCAAPRDGDCSHQQCPQLRDNEPGATGRHCPLDAYSDED